MGEGAPPRDVRPWEPEDPLQRILVTTGIRELDGVLP